MYNHNYCTMTSPITMTNTNNKLENIILATLESVIFVLFKYNIPQSQIETTFNLTPLLLAHYVLRYEEIKIIKQNEPIFTIRGNQVDQTLSIRMDYAKKAINLLLKNNIPISQIEIEFQWTGPSLDHIVKKYKEEKEEMYREREMQLKEQTVSLLKDIKEILLRIESKHN